MTKRIQLALVLMVALAATAMGHKQQRQKTADELFIAFLRTHPPALDVDGICEDKNSGLSQEVMTRYCSVEALTYRSSRHALPSAVEKIIATKPGVALHIDSTYVGAVLGDSGEMEYDLAAAGILTQAQNDDAYGELKPSYTHQTADYNGYSDGDISCESDSTGSSCTDGVTTTYTQCNSDGSCTGGTVHNTYEVTDGYELVANGIIVWYTPATSAYEVVNQLVERCKCGHTLAGQPSGYGTLADYMKTNPPAVNVKAICDNGFGTEHRQLTADERENYCKLNN